MKSLFEILYEDVIRGRDDSYIKVGDICTASTNPRYLYRITELNHDREQVTVIGAYIRGLNNIWRPTIDHYEHASQARIFKPVDPDEISI
jgi:hypothetical protein